MAPRDNGHSEGLAGGTQDGGAVQPKKEAGALADMVARIPSGDDRARRDEGEPRTWPNGGTCGCIAIHACGLATDRYCIHLASMRVLIAAHACVRAIEQNRAWVARYGAMMKAIQDSYVCRGLESRGGALHGTKHVAVDQACLRVHVCRCLEIAAALGG